MLQTLHSATIISWNGNEFDASSNHLLLSLDGEVTKLVMSNVACNEYSKNIITYEYQTNIKCGSVKDAHSAKHLKSEYL